MPSCGFAVEAHDAGQVPLLHPELGRDRQLVEQVRQHLLGLEHRPVEALAESRLGEVADENARVVAEAVDRRRVRPEPLLAHPRIARRCVSGEVDAGHGDALERRRQRRDPPVGDSRKAERGQIQERRPEPRRHEHVVDLEEELPAHVVPCATTRKPPSRRSMRSIVASTT